MIIWYFFFMKTKIALKAIGAHSHYAEPQTQTEQNICSTTGRL